MIDTKISSEQLMKLENEYGAHNYHPLPVVIAKGEGVHVWDAEGKKYYDFLSAYSAVNQGHCHPKILKTIQEQAAQLTLTSRAFYNDKLGQFEKLACELFGYDKLLPMNTGAEAVETAIKICRKWAYEVKGINENDANIIVCTNNFHGRTTTIISFSNDPDARKNFGPYTPGFVKVDYDDIEALEQAINKTANVAGFLVEPIQGEAGVFVPQDGYLAKAKALCEKNNILFMGDEIQTGIARTGKMLCLDHEDVKADILILGKALSGGFYPVSAVLADDHIMNVIKPGQHGSTYGGNPLGAAVAITALRVIQEEKLAENAEEMGVKFRTRIQKNLVDTCDLVKLVRGKGLLNAIVINDSEDSDTAWRICLKLRDNGLLAKPTHGNIIRFAPPLVMTEEELYECCSIIEETISTFVK